MGEFLNVSAPPEEIVKSAASVPITSQSIPRPSGSDEVSVITGPVPFSSYVIGFGICCAKAESDEKVDNTKNADSANTKAPTNTTTQVFTALDDRFNI